MFEMVYLQTFLVLFFNHYETTSKVVMSTMGRTFLVAFPMLEKTNGEDLSSITFYLMTHAVIETQVIIVTRHFETGKENLSVNISLNPYEITNYLLPRKYYSQISTGKKGTYKLSCTERFQLGIYLAQNPLSSSYIQAVPVEAWDKIYLAVTLFLNSSIQVIAVEKETEVDVLVRIKAYPDFTDRPYRTVKLEFTLNSEEAYEFGNCTDGKAFLTGTRITGTKPLGVISGNCGTYTTHHYCLDKRKAYWNYSVTSDLVSEMLMPASAFGTEFIAVRALKRIPMPLVTIVARSVNTIVKVGMPNSNFEDFHLEGEGDWWNVYQHFHVPEDFVIRSNKMIQVVLIQPSPCLLHDGKLGESLGDTAMSLLVPNSLFYVAYYWRTVPAMEASFIIIIAEPEHHALLLLDQKPLSQSYKWNDVLGISRFKTINLQVNESPRNPACNHSVTSINFYRFGLYVYGMSRELTYMHPAGFQDCRDPHRNGDIIEQNCFKIELVNSTTSGHTTEGGWGPWHPWVCSKDCSIKVYFRERFCNIPVPSVNGEGCVGEIMEEHFQLCPCAEHKDGGHHLFWLPLLFVLIPAVFVVYVLRKKKIIQLTAEDNNALRDFEKSIRYSDVNEKHLNTPGKNKKLSANYEKGKKSIDSPEKTICVFLEKSSKGKKNSNLTDIDDQISIYLGKARLLSPGSETSLT